MKAEKIFKDKDGNRYKVSVILETSLHYSLISFDWQVDVAKCPKGKRKFQSLHGNIYDSREFRGLNRDARRDKINRIILDTIPREWVLEVQAKIIDTLKAPCI